MSDIEDFSYHVKKNPGISVKLPLCMANTSYQVSTTVLISKDLQRPELTKSSFELSPAFFGSSLVGYMYNFRSVRVFKETSRERPSRLALLMVVKKKKKTRTNFPNDS